MLSKALISLAFLLYGTYSYGEDCNLDAECLTYADALNKAKYPSDIKEIPTLRPLRQKSKDLKFDSEGRVLLTRVDKFTYWNYNRGDKVTTSRQGWYTVYPDLQEACKSYIGTDLSKRIKQILGLPPNKQFDGIVEIYAPLTALFRPCPDPEIYDKQCVYEIPVTNTATTDSAAPWYCPSDDEEVVQYGENYVDVKNSHFKWMCKTWNNNYGNTGTYNNYPWTGLGYTYDWGTQSGIGLSEFILETNTEVVFRRKMTVEEYCKANSN